MKSKNMLSISCYFESQQYFSLFTFHSCVSTFWRRRREDSRALLVLPARGIATSHHSPKNSLPDCFFTARAHIGFKSPRHKKITTKNACKKIPPLTNITARYACRLSLLKSEKVKVKSNKTFDYYQNFAVERIDGEFEFLKDTIIDRIKKNNNLNIKPDNYRFIAKILYNKTKRRLKS